MKVKVIIVLLGVFLLNACYNPFPTKYNKGMPEVMLSQDSWVITFKANASTTKKRVEDYTLLKSAETVLGNGYSYFIVLKDEMSTTEDNYYGFYTAYQIFTKLILINDHYIHYTYTSKQTIKAFKSKDEIKDSNAVIYDANIVKEAIKTAYKIK